MTTIEPTEAEMNVKLCEALGWKRDTHSGMFEGGPYRIGFTLPNHFSDSPDGMMACYVAEKTLSETQHESFRRILAEQAGLSPHCSFREVVSSSAPQRAKALYLTLCRI